jgi:hypothetical protein
LQAQLIRRVFAQDMRILAVSQFILACLLIKLGQDKADPGGFILVLY